MPYKRPLDASFYGGPPAPQSSNDANVVLSRGNVFRLLNGHWMLCQDGCIDCEPCAAQRNPLFKWILQRVEHSLSSRDLPRHELRLTIIPQTDDHLHADNLWPNSYIYLMSQGQRDFASIANVDTTRDDGIFSPKDSSTPSALEDSFSAQHDQSPNLWRLAERDSAINRDDNRTTMREGTSSTEKEESPESRQRFKDARRRFRSRSRAMENPGEETSRLMPKLILGTDRRGQKHLVHVIPADHPPAIIGNSHIANHLMSPSQLASNQTTRSNDTKRERQTYQRMFRRIFDSLNTHRRSIEDFLETDRHWTPATMNGSDGFNWNNRGINYTLANFAQLRRPDGPSPSFYMQNDDGTAERRPHRGRYGHEDTRQDDYYLRYRDAEMPRSQMNLDWDKERRRMRVKPYSANSVSISGISPSIPSQTSDNLSANPRSDLSNDSVDSTLVNNGIIKLDPVATRRGNGSSIIQAGEAEKRRR